MPIDVVCPNVECGRQISAPDAAAGKRVRCPGCKTALAVPGANPHSSHLGTLSGPNPPPASTARPAGETVGRFVVRGKLGAGAFGTVYRAFDPQLQREVALKVPNAGVLDSPKRVERFLREARSAANLTHPHIVPVFDAGQDGERYYIASAFIDGKSLADTIPEGGTDFRRAATLARELAEALGYAHGQGVVHRDVKPANCLVDAADGLHLADFGLAAKSDDTSEAKLTNDGAVLGTPAYMAPEQAAGQQGEAKPASDQYAVGVVLYELLTGRTPFTGPPAVVIYNVLNIEPDRPSSVRSSIPRDLETICTKAMAKRPEDRYADCEALADDLRRWLDDEPIVARRLRRTERVVRWARKNKAVAAAAGVTTAALALVAVVSTIAAALAFQAETDQARLRTDADRQASRATAEAGRAATEADRARTAEQAAVREAAEATLRHGTSVCDSGRSGFGLLLLAHGLEAAVKSGDKSLAEAYRWNLGAWSAEHPELVRMYDHPGSIEAADFSPDGRFVHVGGSDGMVRTWDWDHGVEVGGPLAHPAGIRDLAILTEPDRLGTTCSDGRFRVWDLTTRKEIAAGPIGPSGASPGGNLKMATDPNGGRVVVGTWASGAVLLSSTSAEQLRTLRAPDNPQSPVEAIAFFSDGRTLTVDNLAVARIWNQTGDEVVGGPFESSDRGVRTSAAGTSMNGRVFAAGHMHDSIVRFFTTADGEPAGEVPHTNQVRKISVSPDGNLWATASEDTTVRLWSQSARQLVGPPLRHEAAVRAASFSPDGTRLVTGTTLGRVRIWSINARPDLLLRHPDRVNALAFDPTGDRLLTSTCYSRCFVSLWDLSTGRPTVRERANSGWPVVGGFADDGLSAVVALNNTSGHRGGSVYRWGLGGPLDADPIVRHPDEIWQLGLAPGGGRAVLGSWYARPPKGQNARVFDPDAREYVGEPVQYAGAVLATAFGPDGRQLLTGSRDGRFELSDPDTVIPLQPRQDYGAEVYAVAFSRSGREIAVGGADWAVRRYDAATLALAGRPAIQHLGTVSGIGYAFEDRILVTASMDGSTRLWHAATGHSIGPPHYHHKPIIALAVDSDGRQVATGGADAIARVWDIPEPPPVGSTDWYADTERRTGLTLDGDSTRVLTVDEWQQR